MKKIILVSLILVLLVGCNMEKCEEAAKIDFGMIDPVCEHELLISDCTCYDKDEHCKNLSCSITPYNRYFDLR